MTVDPVTLDAAIRLAAFNWLEEQTAIHGDVLPWRLLQGGFEYDGRRVPLLSMQGIFKPAVLPELPLTIRTSHEGPYDDHFGYDDLLRYRYRGTDPQEPDNVRLRSAMRHHTPLIYLHGVVTGRYLAVWPVYIVGDDPGTLTFSVAADDARAARSLAEAAVPPPEVELRRRYATRDVRQRLHQRGFRERVLRAYRGQCPVCKLRHAELLEAAHIVPDTEPGGDPVVPNGLSLCRLHHGAFDHLLIGIRPDHTVEVRQSILEEEDGPMLLHGLKEIHDQRIWTPRSHERRPNPELLERRYERFRRAG